MAMGMAMALLFSSFLVWINEYDVDMMSMDGDAMRCGTVAVTWLWLGVNNRDNML